MFGIGVMEVLILLVIGAMGLGALFVVVYAAVAASKRNSDK